MVTRCYLSLKALVFSFTNGLKGEIAERRLEGLFESLSSIPSDLTSGSYSQRKTGLCVMRYLDDEIQGEMRNKLKRLSFVLAQIMYLCKRTSIQSFHVIGPIDLFVLGHLVITPELLHIYQNKRKKI